MILTILYEKHQIQKIESETFEIRTILSASRYKGCLGFSWSANELNNEG